MLSKVLGQPGFVLRCLVPHLSVTDFEEQQSVVILTDEVFHVRILFRKFLCALLVYEVARVTRCLRQRVHLLVDHLFANTARIDEADDVRAQRVVGEEIPPLLHQDDVVTERRTGWLISPGFSPKAASSNSFTVWRG